MIKVLEVLPDLGSGGAEKLVVDLMTNFDKTKIDATLVVMFNQEDKPYYKYLKDNGCKVVFLDKKPGLDVSIFFKFWKLINKIKPDVIHSHRYVNLYLFPYYLFHKKQRGYHTVHNIATKEQSKIYRKITGWLYKYRKVEPVAISNFISNTINKEYKLENKFTTIYNGVNTFHFIKKDNYNIGDKINFIAVGRLTAQKNYPLMIKAFVTAYQTNNNITLNILGEGELKEQIECLINDLNLQDVVKLNGVVRNVSECLNKADCFVMSSDYEGLPLSVIEAMSCGLPIISTKAGGVVDIVQNNVNGILVDVRDEQALTNAIIEMTDKIKIEQYGKKSYEMSKQYDIKNCVKQYEDLFING